MARSYANTPDGIRRLNTNVVETNDGLMVRLYSTVVYIETNTEIVLNHGGWVTPTTKSRIHQALRYRGHKNNVNIKNGEMYCDGKPFKDQTFIILKEVA